MKERLIHWTVHRPWQSITLAIVLTLVLASGIRFIHIDDDMMKMLPENIPSRGVWNDIENQFGATEGVYVSIGREGQSIFTPESMALIWDLTRAYEDLAIVDQVRSIASMSKIENVDGFLEVDDLMPARDLTTGEIAGIKAYLDRNPVVARMMMARTGDFANVMILALPGTSDEKLVTAIGQVQETWAYGYDHHIGGLPYIRGFIAKFVRADVIGLMRIGLVLLVVVLLASLRSIPGLLMVLGIIILPVIAMMGFFGWVYHLTQSERFNFTILNSNMPIILLTIATADGVHIMTRFFREMRNRSDVKASVTATMDVLMLPVFLTSITTMAGFITLVTAPISAMMGYGLAVSFGIAWAWYLSVTLLPSVMVLTKWDPSAKALTSAGRFERGIHHMGQVILRRPRLVLGTGVLVVLLSLVGITMLRVEVNIVKFFKPSSALRQSMEFLDSHFYGATNLALRVTGDIKDPAILRAMEDLQAELEQDEAIGTTFSLADIIAQLHRVVMDDSVKYEVIPETRAKVANLLTLYSMSGDPDDFNALVDYDYQTALINATMKVVSTAKMVEIVDHMDEYLASNTPPDMDVQISGFPVFITDFTQLIIFSSLRSLALSLVFVVIISWIFFKSLRWGLLAVVPLGSAIILNFGLMGWTGIELSHVTAMLTAIIIGVGVDFAVHFIAQYRHFMAQGLPQEEITQAAIDDVGYPILLNVTAVSVGFSALLASEFVPMGYMGGLVIISMISCAIGTLTIMAVMIHLMRSKVTA